jgi:hypothetical protein
MACKRPGTGIDLSLPYYGGGQRVWCLRRLSCGNVKLASPHLIAPVISREAVSGCEEFLYDLKAGPATTRR